MSEEELDNWDEECMNILLQVEEKTLSSFSSSSQPFSQTRSLLRPPESRRTAVDHSPPRELSNRPHRDDRELQIEGLKSELGRVSKQLLDLEQECSKLREERDKKNEQLNSLSSRNEETGASQRHLNCPNLGTECEDSGDHREISRRYQTATSCCKATGVQTDDGGCFGQVFLHDEIRTCQDLSKKLLDIWDLPNNETLGINLISNLLVACQTDLHELFSCMGMNLSMKPRSGSPACESSNAVVPHYPVHFTSEASKVSHFYSVLTKINNGMEHVEALLEPLIDLCTLENVVVIHRSLRILHVFLKHLFSLNRKSGERDNIVVEGLGSGFDILNSKGFGASEKRYSLMGMVGPSCAGDALLGSKFSYAESLYEKQQWKPSVSNSVSRVDWVSLFEALLLIAKRKTEEIVRGEAVSIMNIILIRSNAYTDRERFGNTQVFESMSLMLRKESGLHVQKQSVQLLYLLLNCPKLLVAFCCGCTEEESTNLMITDDTSPSPKFAKILWGLADCITCTGSGLEEMELRRKVIVLLAFLASSEKSGFDILVSSKLPKDANFLILIMQILMSEIEIEATNTPKSPEVFNERALLIREALILLNRLISNPIYSAIALQILTKSRDMASMTVDIANRLSKKDQRNGHFDGVVGTTRKSEVVDLAQVFKKRVFTYMGNHIS